MHVGAKFFVEPSPLEAGEGIVVSLSEVCEGTRWGRCDFEQGLVDLIDEGLILLFILEIVQVLNLLELFLELNQIRDFLQYL